MKGNTSPIDFRIKGRIPFIARCVVHPHLSFGRHTMNHVTTYLNRKEAKSMKKHLLNFTLFLMYLTLPLMATAQVVNIPDPNLRAAIEKALGKAAGATITVEEMAKLTSFDARNANISDLTGLEHATNLYELDLSRNSISDISALAGLTFSPPRYLRSKLDLSNNSISDISALARLTGLNQLSLSNNNISDVSALAGLTGLGRLSLSHNGISDISALAGLTGLGWLSLSHNGISDISALSGLTRLNWLSLSYNSISDISALAGLTGLGGLSLSHNGISDISALAGLTGLGWLSLSYNNISDISALAGLTLAELSLSYNSISDISALSGLTRLNWLSLSYNSISDISALAGLTGLAELSLDNNNISDLSPLVLNVEVQAYDNANASLDISVRGNPLNDTSINTHIPFLWSRGVEGLSRTKLILPPIAPVAVGQRFTLDLTIKNVSDLAGWQLDLAFNPVGLLKAISVSEGSFLSRNDRNTFFQEGNINNAAGSITGISGVVIDTGGVSGSGTLFSVTFEARAAGEGWLRVSEDRLGAANGNQIHCETVIQPVIVGLTYDLNADGKVDLLDLTLVAQNFGKANPQADANHDGGVNVFDLIAVAQHIGESAAPQAPMVRREQRSLFPIHLLPKTVQNWIDMAHAADDGSLAFRQGIANLKQLLAAMVPDKTALLTNYPNPFNPETWVPYQLANDAEVQLTIYDTKGVVVRRLDLGHQRAGYYTDRTRAAYWDGLNESGESVTSGIYFYQLRTGKFSAMRKMVILK